MLVGTLLLGLLLGYLIWGWTRRKLLESEAQMSKLTSSNTALQQKLAESIEETEKRRKEFESLNETNRNLNKELYSINTSHADLKKELVGFSHSLEENKAELTRLQSIVAANESLISTLYAQLSDEQSINVDLKTSLNELRNDQTSRFDVPKTHDADIENDQIPQPDKSIELSTSHATESKEVDDPPVGPELFAMASQIFDKEIRLNDLAIVYGVSPRIAEVLVKSGITSWIMLSETTRHILRVILDKAGPEFHGNKTKSWPRQARMAADGEWRKLRAYQDVLADRFLNTPPNTSA